MAKVNFAPDIESISGKLCSKSGVIYSVNKQTGNTYRSERHEHTDANTEAQQQVRTAFVTRAKLAAAWWNANKPSSKQPKGSDNYQLVIKAYKSQHKIGNPFGYLRTLVGDDMKVRLGDLDITGNVKTPASAGSGSTSAGSGSTGSGGSASGGSGSGSTGSGGSGSSGSDSTDEG